MWGTEEGPYSTQTLSDPDFIHPVTLTFPKALEPVIGSSVSSWRERENPKPGSDTEGFMGQAGVGAPHFYSFLSGQNSIP